MAQELPNLANATPTFLIDEMGKLRAEIKKLQQLEGYYKEALKGRWPEDIATIEAETYICTKEDVVQSRIDTAGIKIDMGEAWVKEHSKIISFIQFKIKVR